MTFKFSDYYNDENICLSEERIRELLIDYLKEHKEGENENGRGSGMITVGAFLSYAYTGMQIQRFDEKKQEYDRLYSIDEFVDRYGDKRVKWFSVTNGCGYLVISLEES